VVDDLLNVGPGGFGLVAEHGPERGGKLLMRLSMLHSVTVCSVVIEVLEVS